jgi:hypothetical protein
VADFGSRVNQVKRTVSTCLQNLFFFIWGGGCGVADQQTPFICVHGLTPVQKNMGAASSKCLLLTRPQEDAQYERAYT